ncbi:MAG: hypothetical protein MR550_00310 [Bacilli bacterium]|nr:hypothetical protein [Bacilli bacterium]
MTEEKLCHVIKLGDNIEYTEIDRVNYNHNTYVILSDLDNPNDFCVKKLINENNYEYIIELNNKEEFNNVLKIFIDKYTN